MVTAGWMPKHADQSFGAQVPSSLICSREQQGWARIEPGSK
jgi:hypothetical protein